MDRLEKVRAILIMESGGREEAGAHFFTLVDSLRS